MSDPALVWSLHITGLLPEGGRRFLGFSAVTCSCRCGTIRLSGDAANAKVSSYTDEGTNRPQRSPADVPTGVWWLCSMRGELGQMEEDPNTEQDVQHSRTRLPVENV